MRGTANILFYQYILIDKMKTESIGGYSFTGKKIYPLASSATATNKFGANVTKKIRDYSVNVVKASTVAPGAIVRKSTVALKAIGKTIAPLASSATATKQLVATATNKFGANATQKFRDGATATKQLVANATKKISDVVTPTPNPPASLLPVTPFDAKTNEELDRVVVGMEISDSKLKDIIYRIITTKELKKNDIKNIYKIVKGYGEYIGLIDYIKNKWVGNKKAVGIVEKNGLRGEFKIKFDIFYETFKNQDITDSGLIETLIDIALNKSKENDKEETTMENFMANVKRLMKCSETILSRQKRDESKEEKQINTKTPPKCIGFIMGGKTKSRSQKRTIRCKTAKKGEHAAKNKK